ncbi:hypothetical protein [Paraburkholderia sp. DGU8]|uniref:hypothetical protein n=1 Tax=Paraburkholderia sp. DGU8 TaxID=3161997 RepID=UPI003466DDD9
MALGEGRLTPSAYAEQRLCDAGTKHLMDKVRVSSSTRMSGEFPEFAQARVSILVKNGTVHSHFQENPKGNASNPLSDAELESKFVEFYAPWGGEMSARRALEVMWDS